jgi:hypothetical protein
MLFRAIYFTGARLRMICPGCLSERIRTRRASPVLAVDLSSNQGDFQTFHRSEAGSFAERLPKDINDSRNTYVLAQPQRRRRTDGTCGYLRTPRQLIERIVLRSIIRDDRLCLGSRERSARSPGSSLPLGAILPNRVRVWANKNILLDLGYSGK